MHCGAKWLFQFDLSSFFYDITEVDVYRIFNGLGYRRLLAFELARICTTTHLPKRSERLLWCDQPAEREGLLPYRGRVGVAGVLPQGAPTSPMLSNLAARELDEKLQEFSRRRGFVYTRYADDITLSATRLSANESVARIRRSVIGIIRQCRFRENTAKIRIAGPGSRKVVLGLLVDGDQPRISKATYSRIDRHLHAAEKFGVVETAEHEGFDSAYGFYNHLAGLVSFTRDVDRGRGNEFSKRLARIETPWNLKTRRRDWV